MIAHRLWQTHASMQHWRSGQDQQARIHIAGPSHDAPSALLKWTKHFSLQARSIRTMTASAEAGLSLVAIHMSPQGAASLDSLHPA